MDLSESLLAESEVITPFLAIVSGLFLIAEEPAAIRIQALLHKQAHWAAYALIVAFRYIRFQFFGADSSSL
jgi:hypothetical protein